MLHVSIAKPVGATKSFGDGVDGYNYSQPYDFEALLWVLCSLGDTCCVSR